MIPTVLWIVALCIPLGLVLYMVIAFALYAGNSFNSFGKGFEQLGQSVEIGGTTADAAATVAASQPPGSLSVSELNSELPKYAWVDGATNVPYFSATRYIVGVNASGTHIVTALKTDPDFCYYGLSVSAAADPLVAADDLPGPGTYFQMVWQVSQCVADQAPASGWQSWPLPQ